MQSLGWIRLVLAALLFVNFCLLGVDLVDPRRQLAPATRRKGWGLYLYLLVGVYAAIRNMLLDTRVTEAVFLAVVSQVWLLWQLARPDADNEIPIGPFQSCLAYWFINRTNRGKRNT